MSKMNLIIIPECFLAVFDGLFYYCIMSSFQEFANDFRQILDCSE